MKSNKSILQSVIVILIIIILISVTPLSTALADTIGPFDPHSGINQTDIGSEEWQNPDEITSPGSPLYATVTLRHGHLESNYLQGTDYRFTIPAEATIEGIEVQINRMSDSRNPNVVDTEVRLVKGGKIVGANRALPDSWPTTLTLVTYGGPTDLWGLTLLPADVNSPDFGAVLAAHRDNNGNSQRQALVDSMQIKVYYDFTASTTIECESPVVYGDNTTCTATVTRVIGDHTPSGLVNWTSDSSSSFSPNPCTLSGSDGISSCTVTYNPNVVGSGTHVLTAAYAGDTFFGPSSDSQAITVNPKAASVTPAAKTKVYGAADPTLTGTLTGFLAGDNITATYSRTAGETVLGGSYTISAVLSPADVLSNYDITYNSAGFTITTKPASVTPDAQTKVYGAADPALTGTLNGFLVGDSVTAAYSRIAGETVLGGPYTISAILSPADVLSNYDITYNTAGFTITTKAASVTPDVQTKVYGAADPALTGTLNGFLVGDSVIATYSRTPGETVLGSPYTISASLSPESALSNYDISYNMADFTITKADATCSISGYTGTYDAASHSATGSCTGIGSENAGTLNPGASYTNVPGGTAHWIFTGNGNYNDQSGDVLILISKAEAVCLVTPYVVEYDRQSHTATGTCTGVLGGELTGIDLTGTTHTEISSYPSDPWTFIDAAGNYNAVNGSVNDEITLRKITVTADAKSKAFGQPDPELTYQVTSGTRLAGDSFSGVLIRQLGEAKGTYPILQGSLSLSDYYVITYVGANFTINGIRYFYPLILKYGVFH